MGKKTTYILAAVVISAAALYFSLTYYRTINPDDEGYLLYNCLKVAEGQVPHRDFYDDYGPAVYWLGGSLFKLFGTKLIVIRVFVLALKTAMALLIFLIGRKLLPPAFALLASLFFVICWGDPYFPAINILHSGSISYLFTLIGILFMIAYVEKENRLWLMGTAACLGLSALFKFHQAIFDFIGFSLFLSLKEGAAGLGADAKAAPSEDGSAAPSRFLRVGKLLGAPLVALFYLSLFARDRLDLYYFFIFLLPYFLLLGHIFVSDVRLLRGCPPTQGASSLRNCYFEILTLACGVTVFIAAALVYYYRVGGLEELIYDTIALPLAMNFYLPMEDYRLHAGLIAAAVILLSSLAWGAVRLRERSQTARDIFLAVCFVLIVLPPAALILGNAPLESWHKHAIYLLSPVTLMICAYLLLSAWKRERPDGRNTRATLLLALVFIFACQGYIAAFPRTDPTHIQINSTVLFVLVALLLHTLYAEWGGPASMRGKIRGAMLAAACAAVLAAPFLLSMQKFYVFSPDLPDRLKTKLPPPVLQELEMGLLEAYPELEFDFPTSAGLTVPMWPVRPLHTFVLRYVVEVAGFIEKNTGKNDEIFVMCEPQILYFLTGKSCFLGKEDYFLYLAIVELIDDPEDVRLSDDQLMRRLAEERPRFVIKVLEQFGDQTQRIADIWPNAAEYVDANYERAAKFGVYEVLQPRGSHSVRTRRK